MDAGILTIVLIIACVPAFNGFIVPAPLGLGSIYESSYEPAEPVAGGEAVNSPGLLLLHGPPGAGADTVEVDFESESEFEAADAADGNYGGNTVGQARPDSGWAGGAGAAAANPGNAPGAGVGQAVPGGPQQISSGSGGAAVGFGLLVGAAFFVVLGVGVAIYIIRRRRQTQNNPERLQ